MTHNPLDLVVVRASSLMNEEKIYFMNNGLEFSLFYGFGQYAIGYKGDELAYIIDLRGKGKALTLDMIQDGIDFILVKEVHDI